MHSRRIRTSWWRPTTLKTANGLLQLRFDGRLIFALVHNEFNGHLRPRLCPSRVYSRCWENSLTLMTSLDGRAIVYPAENQKTEFHIPYRYLGDVGSPIGYFQPSNILRHDGYYYVLFTVGALPEPRGSVSDAYRVLSDAASWRAWDGQDFAIDFANPYISKIDDPRRHLCLPLKDQPPLEYGRHDT